jgi:hypothetical protein
MILQACFPQVVKPSVFSNQLQLAVSQGMQADKETWL